MKKVEYVEPEKDKNQEIKNSAKIPNIKEIRLIPQSFPKKRFSFFSIFLFFVSIFLLLSIIESVNFSMSPKVAVINLNGVIVSGEQGSFLDSDYVNSKFIVDEINRIKNDPTYKAVVFSVNSPGGSPVASNEISNSIEELKKNNISVYSYVYDIAASGAYWVIAPSSKIYSNELSLIGSFGVTSAGFGFENFIEEYNITYRRYVAGEYKDFLSPFREPTQREENITQNLLNSIHYKFIEHISDSRNISFEKVYNLSTGEIFLANRAKQENLIDEISSYNDMVEHIEENMSERPIYVEITKPKSFIQELGLNSIKINLESGFENNKISLK